jgi:hypothetical protein
LNHRVRGCNARLTAKTKPYTKLVRVILVKKKTKKRKSLILAKEENDGYDETVTSLDESSGKE